MARVFLWLVALSICVLPKPVFGQDQTEGCTRLGRPIHEVGLVQSFNDFRADSNSISSLFASIRFCRPGGRLQWHLEGALDRVDTRGPTTTSGRVGAGIYHLLTPRWAQSSFGMGLTVRAGYEDFDVPLFDPSGSPRRLRGNRLTKSAEISAVFSHQDHLRDGGSFPVRTYRLEGSISYVDKRSPAQGVPTFLTESFMVARAAIAFEPFIFHNPFGSRVEFRVQHDQYFTARSNVNGITTLRLQWRPQRNPAFDNPDRFAVSLAFNVGDEGYSGWTFALIKAF